MLKNETIKELLQLEATLAYAEGEEGMEVAITCGWDGEAEDGALIPREVLPALRAWCVAVLEESI